jgi:hypothetical protein
MDSASSHSQKIHLCPTQKNKELVTDTGHRAKQRIKKNHQLASYSRRSSSDEANLTSPYDTSGRAILD